MNEEERKYYFMRTHLGMNPDEIYKITNVATLEKIPSLTETSLSYNKTFEEEMEEQRKIELAINYLENLGVEIRIKYGGYRNIYNVLKDLGECLDKPCIKCYHYNWDMPQCKECGSRNNYKYFVGSEI